MTFDDLERALRKRGDVVIGTGCGDTLVRDAERVLGLTFPLALRDYLIRFGHLELGHLELYGLGADLPHYLDLVKTCIASGQLDRERAASSFGTTNAVPARSRPNARRLSPSGSYSC